MSTKPRQVLPGFTYLITRRCAQRQFLLRPSAHVTATVAYALARTAKRYGVELHAWCVLSNHVHLVATDAEGRIPDFLRDFDSLVARALNAHLGRWENFWASGEPNLVRLVEEEDVFDKVLYTLSNPVSSGLVPDSHLWPGLLSHPQAMDEPLEVHRPESFFRRPAGDKEEPLELAVTPPRGWSLAAYQQHLKRAVFEREVALRTAREASGQGFLGLLAIRRQSASDAPSSPAPRRKLSPRIACKNSAKRFLVLHRLGRFVEQYREAYQDFAAGVRDALFPLGTFLMRVRYQVQTAGGS